MAVVCVIAGLGQIPGQYNIAIEGAYETFEHQIPVKEFLQRLKENDVPEKVSVVGLADALSDDDLANELARAGNQKSKTSDDGD